jgi:hypothetical protein
MLTKNDLKKLKWKSENFWSEIERNFVYEDAVECVAILHRSSDGHNANLRLECAGVIPEEWQHRRVRVVLALKEDE